MFEEKIEVAPQEAARELLRRREARESLIAFSEYTMEKYRADRFHHMVADHLEEIVAKKNDRLMIFAPPRHGKSELSTRRFPAFFLGHYPDQSVISASYNAEFARGFGRNVRDIVASDAYGRLFPGVGIRSDNRAADEWELDQGGKYFAVGVGTGTTGRGANLFMIDDPIKDRKEADSETNRETQWDWYRDVVYTRLEEDASIILTLTRWHYDDIAGRLIELMNAGKGKPWKILTLPALPIVVWTKDENGKKKEPILNDDGTVPSDPLRRKPDEALAPNRFSTESLKDRQEVLGERSWSALYQQQPMSEDGGMFRSTWFKIAEKLSPKRTRVRAWDLASTMDGDFTVGALMSRDKDGVFVVEDVVRFRGSPLEVESRILKTAQNDGRSVDIRLPQDPGSAGKAWAERLVRMLAGYRVKALRPNGPKETRAAGFAAQAEAGNVFLVKAHWNQVFLDELETFPLGVNDDQVDAAADAFNALLGPQRWQQRDW